MCVCLRLRDIDGAVGVVPASDERVARCEEAVAWHSGEHDRERGQSQKIIRQLLRLVIKSAACATGVQVRNKLFKSPELESWAPHLYHLVQ